MVNEGGQGRCVIRTGGERRVEDVAKADTSQGLIQDARGTQGQSGETDLQVQRDDRGGRTPARTSTEVVLTRFALSSRASKEMPVIECWN